MLKSIITFLTLAATSAIAAPPQLIQVDRVLTKASATSSPILIKDAKGNRLFVTAHKIESNPSLLQLAAYQSDGSIYAEMKIQTPTGGAHGISIVNAKLDASGDLVVVTSFYQNGVTLGQLTSHHLNKAKSTDLLDIKGNPNFLDRIRFNGRNLVAVSGDLNQPNGSYKAIVRIVDEDTGFVLSEAKLTHAVSGSFGFNKRGELKLLVMGYELFGLLDPTSGQFTELLPVRTQPSFYPFKTNLSIGEVAALSDGSSLRLLDTQELLNGNIQALRTYELNTEFIQNDTAVTYSAQGIVITDIATQRPLGPMIPIPAQDNREGARLAAIFREGTSTIGVVTQLLDPNSFLPGTRLTYIDVKSGQLLRSRSVRHDGITPSLHKLSNGRLISIERNPHGRTEPGIRVIDLFSDTILAQTSIDEAVGSAFFSESQDLTLLRAGNDLKLCAFRVLNPTEETCVTDPLVTAAARYGYTPFEIQNGKFLAPLLKAVTNHSFTVMGFSSFRVR